MNSAYNAFRDIGGVFHISAAQFQNKLSAIRAFLFDWDGVFNSGQKGEKSGSNFSEADSMGLNLMRFGFWMHHGQLPLTGIITGEDNPNAIFLAQREHLTAIYSKSANKYKVFEHFVRDNQLSPDQVAYVFDDVLDLPLAKVCGLRVLVNRVASPMFKAFVVDNRFADYVTANEGRNFAVRETCELFLGVNGWYNEAVQQRYEYTQKYQDYLQIRQAVSTRMFHVTQNNIARIYDIF